MKSQLGHTMGEPVECEHTNPENGDALQQTSKGLAFYRKFTNTPTFTNGWEHWGWTRDGLVYWTGNSTDPPGVAPPTPTPGPTPTTTPTPSSPTPAPTPTPMPVRASGWENAVVRTVCLKVDQQYPGLQGVTPEPIAEAVQRLLAASGIAVTGGEGACDAELAISLRFEALSRIYTGGKRCYSGASAGGVLALTADERAVLEVPVTFTRGAPFVIYGCAELASD